MTSLSARSARKDAPVVCHDRVRVSDGRIGEVIGFYRRDVLSVLVKFASGKPCEFLSADVELVS